jgi:dTDP-4-amino-4,6-dideoxygalactose transaminase
MNMTRVAYNKFHYNEVRMHIPFVDLKAQYIDLKGEIDGAIKEVIEESAFIGGKFVRRFESEFADRYGVKHMISCANGTDSLYIIMKMLGIGNGDEVITAANSWISSSETISQTGARPIFLDIDPDYYSMDDSLLESKITSKTKAILAVHLHGQMCNIERISEICQKNGIFLIEDCAQAHFAEYKGIRAGLSGIAGSFSFFPGKNLGAYGDAGCIITNNDALAQKCRMFANHGALQKHHHLIEGVNSRMDGIQAAILSAKLPHLAKWTAARIEIAKKYDLLLSGVNSVNVPKVRPNSTHTFHLYVVVAAMRDELRTFLQDKGIETLIHYPTPLPFLPAYGWLGYRREEFQVCCDLQQKILSLPIFPELTDAQISYIAYWIGEFYGSSQ